MPRLLVVLHQPAPGPLPQDRADLLVAAVDVAAVDEGRDGVDLFSARLATGGTGAREVYTGYTRILSHWEGGIRLGHIDVETLGSAGVQTAPLLGETGAADVVVQELPQLHHHAAHSLVRVVPLREGSSDNPNVGQIVAREGTSRGEVMRVLWSHKATEGDICSAPVWVLDVVTPPVYPLVGGGKVAGARLDKDCPEIFQVN